MIYSLLGLFYGVAFVATVFAIAEDVTAARRQMRRARVHRPVIALAVARTVRR